MTFLPDLASPKYSGMLQELTEPMSYASFAARVKTLITLAPVSFEEMIGQDGCYLVDHRVPGHTVGHCMPVTVEGGKLGRFQPDEQGQSKWIPVEPTEVRGASLGFIAVLSADQDVSGRSASDIMD